MNDLQKALDHIINQVKLYRKADIMDGETLISILQQITATLHYLETERAKYHNNFQVVINSLILEGKSVARAENEAHIQVPELYQLRHIMASSYELVGAIRSQISWIKSERSAI